MEKTCSNCIHMTDDSCDYHVEYTEPNHTCDDFFNFCLNCTNYATKKHTMFCAACSHNWNSRYNSLSETVKKEGDE